MMQVGLSVVACWQSKGPFVIEYASQGSYPTSLKYYKSLSVLQECITSIEVNTTYIQWYDPLEESTTIIHVHVHVFLTLLCMQQNFTQILAHSLGLDGTVHDYIVRYKLYSLLDFVINDFLCNQELTELVLSSFPFLQIFF